MEKDKCYRLRLTGAELDALREVSERHGVGMTAWVVEAVAVYAALAAPGEPLPGRVAVDHASAAAMAWHARSADALARSAERLSREADRALATAAGGVEGVRASAPRLAHLPLEDARRAVSGAAENLVGLLELAVVRAGDAADEAGRASECLGRVLEEGPLCMPVSRAVPHRDALPRVAPPVLEAGLAEDPTDAERAVLFAGAVPRRAFPPEVTLAPDPAGGRREAQLQLRLGRDELEGLKAVAARLDMSASELLRRAAWAYAVVMDPGSARADRAAVDWGERFRARSYCATAHAAACGLAAWARDLPGRLADVDSALPRPGDMGRMERAAASLGALAEEAATASASVLESLGSLDEDALARLAPLRRPYVDMLLPQASWWEDRER